MTEGPLPVVVHVGFAGSRLLLDPGLHPTVDPATFHDTIQHYLAHRLRQLSGELELSPAHFLCGISQIAAGGDFLFTRACGAIGIPQRIFLSQRRAEYLSAEGSDSMPDFTDAEREEAEALLAFGHIVQERVVSDALEREARFEEVNLEIVRISDFVLCLVRDEVTDGGRGGTADLLERAEHRDKPGLEIRVSVRGGRPHFEETWHRRETFLAPELPGAFAADEALATEADGGLPSMHAYCDALRTIAGKQARRLQSRFTSAALIIILTHILATLTAVIVLKYSAWWNVFLLGGESALLLGGLAMHEYLHHARSARTWALSRLVTEITRTYSALGEVHAYIDFPFHLPMPESLRPLLRTLNVLHLRSTRKGAEDPWQPKREVYVETYLAGPKGQLSYYTRELPRSHKSLKRSRRAFLLFSTLGIVSTLGKLLAVWYDFNVGPDTADLAGVLGVLAMLMPVFAVAALSLASARDLEARVHTYEEMLDFLNDQVEQLISATSEREFVRLMLETESRLLGETANWYSRRSFTGVA